MALPRRQPEPWRVGAPWRRSDGRTPRSRKKARDSAASELYPTSSATLATECSAPGGRAGGGEVVWQGRTAVSAPPCWTAVRVGDLGALDDRLREVGPAWIDDAVHPRERARYAILSWVAGRRPALADLPAEQLELAAWRGVAQLAADARALLGPDADPTDGAPVPPEAAVAAPILE